MRRLLFLGLGSALLVMLGVGPAEADNGPHVSSTLGVGVDQRAGFDRCATCHRSHQAQGELVLAAGQDGQCLACHSSSASGATTDVVDGVGYGAGAGLDRGALRGGGFAYALIGSGMATKETYLSGTSLRTRHQKIPVLVTGEATTSNHGVTGAACTASGNGRTGSVARGPQSR